MRFIEQTAAGLRAAGVRASGTLWVDYEDEAAARVDVVRDSIEERLKPQGEGVQVGSGRRAPARGADRLRGSRLRPRRDDLTTA